MFGLRFGLSLVVLIIFWSSSCRSAPFVPWDPLVRVSNPYPHIESNESWIYMGQERMRMYTVNGGAYEVGFDIADSGDNYKSRGMNSLKFRVGDHNTGHLTSSEKMGSFLVENTGDNRTFSDLLLMVVVDAEEPDFELELARDCNSVDCDGIYEYAFDEANDFSFYDPEVLGYLTGRPSGYYSATDPNAEPLTYFFKKGLVSIYAFEDVNLASLGGSIRIHYRFKRLRHSVVFSVYGYDSNLKPEGWVYHTNRAFPDVNKPSKLISTLAVLPADFSGDGFVNLLDFAVFSRCWLATPDLGNPQDLCYGMDFDEDGQVALPDLEAFAGQYFDGVPP
jgi:hypothetical protein